MASITVRGIIIRHANYRDYDRMLTILTDRMGRLDALARGCRRPRSPLMNASELFAMGEFVFYQKADKYTLTTCTLDESFYTLRLDIDKLCYASYAANLCEAVAQPGQPCPELYQLLGLYLSRLTYGAEDVHELTAGFLTHFINAQGFKPRLRHCVVCGRRVAADEPVSFDMEAGGVCCRSCDHGKAALFSAASRQWLEDTLAAGASGWQAHDAASAPFHLLKNYAEMRLERPIKSGKMLI